MRAARLREAALAAAAALALAGCATTGGRTIAADEAHRALLGPNPGLRAVRAFAEVGIRYLGRVVSLPAALVVDQGKGFRIDLLDPFDRPLAIVFADRGRIVQYRPAANEASALSLFPEACGGLDPALWTAALLASSAGPDDRVRERVRRTWSGDYLLERSLGPELVHAVRFDDVDGRPQATRNAWYCSDGLVMTLRVERWLEDSPWRLPAVFEVDYAHAGLRVRFELLAVDVNPMATPATGPRPAPGTRWSPWELPR